ncbi:MAG: nitrite/sulfite reductase [Rhodospirillaceae bacterium]|jgi:sulfite reductase (NADPH) hemoprotein beta-component
MYRYDDFDRTLVTERAVQFRDQVKRRLAGEITEEEFRPLRLMNGLYMQLHAYMLRVAVPYGMLSSEQMRKLAHIAKRYDRGYGHFTTRQNIQYNWPKLEEVPDILDELADVEMHAIQTSGNCIRNTTADQFAGVAADEIEDPRPYAEVIRQWSTLHPEFAYLPRKFKMALTGSPVDRAAVRFHDIGLLMRRGTNGSSDQTGFQVMVGGGLGRTPFVAKTIREFLPKKDLLSYLTAIMRVYNLLGRRDNMFKARIKILVHETGTDKFTEMVEEEWQHLKDDPAYELPEAELQRLKPFFAPPAYETLEATVPPFEEKRLADQAFTHWVARNVAEHKMPGYGIVTVSLKPVGGIPGDATADQMDLMADLADKYSFGEIRVTHEQNLVLADVKKVELYDLWQELKRGELATPNVGLATDIICCPGLDYCAIANARSIPIAQQISQRFGDLKLQHNIGDLKIKMSGCINACGHHHVGHIGILGVDRKGEEYYQVMLGGDAGENAAIGKILGPAFSKDTVVDAVAAIVNTYLSEREDGEAFLQTYRRIGDEPFKERLYGTD